MQYTVVHSKDPYLLARLATDLQMEGISSKGWWNDMYNLFSDTYGIINSYAAVGEAGKMTLRFYGHHCVGYPTRHELTSSNYIKVLTQILEP